MLPNNYIIDNSIDILDSEKNFNNSEYSREIPKDFKFNIYFNNNIDKKEDTVSESPELEILNEMNKIEISKTFDKYIPNNDWYLYFCDEMSKTYFKFIEYRFNEYKNIYPKKEDIFRAFKSTPLNKIKVLILGQEPYHDICKKTNKPCANGLAFSVNKECSIPSSLQNMYNELERTGFKKRNTGDLEDWAEQGVFLLNSLLSVEKENPNSHIFWKKFTNNVIKFIIEQNKKIVLVLMGRKALVKMKFIKKRETLKIIITSHPSRVSFKKKLKTFPSFYKSNIFLNINKALKELGHSEIKW